jgi:hypothetical protein
MLPIRRHAIHTRDPLWGGTVRAPIHGVICANGLCRALCAMPWRRKPLSSLRYWKGPVDRDARFETVLVYCVRPDDLRGSYHNRCHHNGSLRLADLPNWDWQDISAHLGCTVGYVDTRLDWSEVINFTKGVG